MMGRLLFSRLRLVVRFLLFLVNVEPVWVKLFIYLFSHSQNLIQREQKLLIKL